MNTNDLIQKIKELMIEVNNECFNGDLNISFPIKISNSGKCAGSVMVKTTYGVSTISYMSISKFFNWTEDNLRNVIAHELIHVYEAQILKIKPSHGRHFLVKMYSINQNPKYKVVIRHSMESTKQEKVKEVPYIISADQSKFILLSNSLMNKLDSSRIEKAFGQGYRTGNLSSDKLKGLTISRQFRYTYKLTEKKIKELGL